MVQILKAEQIGKNPEHQEYIYNGLDSCITMELFNILEPKAWDLYEFERLLLGPVFSMMHRGIRVDVNTRDRMVSTLEKDAEKLNIFLKELAEDVADMKDFNYRSPIQMKKILYEAFCLPKQYGTKKDSNGDRRVTTDRQALERLHKQYATTRPFMTLLLAIRDKQKKIEALTKDLSPHNRYHSSYNIGGTETGRFSSSGHPFNIGASSQNITGKLRKIFVADPGKILVSIDLQTAESKGVAYLADDAAYIEACNSSDVHTMVAKDVWPDKVQDCVTAEVKYYRDYSYRDMSKRGQHGSNYYGTPYTMAMHLKIKRQVMEEFQRKYFRRFPGIAEWHRDTIIELQRTGELTTPLGRKRRFWGRLKDDSTVREAIAYKPQSLIGDITNMGLYKIWYYLQDSGVELLGQGHDSVLSQVPEEHLHTLLPQMLDCMTTTIRVYDKDMTIGCDAEVGYNWGKYHPEDNPQGLKEYTNV